MAWPEDGEPWFAFCDRIRSVALDMLQHPIRIEGRPLNNPAPFAAALLSRSLQHLQGVALVARAGLLVEAASLARACVENGLWMRKLHKDSAFASAIMSDSQHHGASFAKRISKSPLDIGLDNDYEQFLSEMVARKGKPIAISNTEGGDEDAERDYFLYRLLSNNFAHPSFSSLNRHLTSDMQMLEIVVEPSVTSEDFDSIFLYALLPLIGMVDYYGQIALGQKDHPRIAALEISLTQLKDQIDARRARDHARIL